MIHSFKTTLAKVFPWFIQKAELAAKEHHPPYFKNGEIWWCSIGENIGSEMYGKGEFYRRPVLVIRKLLPT
jgi:mRNA interferase MazF